MNRILVAIAVLIVYGTLYPLSFVAAPRHSPAERLLDSLRIPQLTKNFVRDLVINITMYVPLGAAGYLAFRHYGKLRALIATLLVGSLLSLTTEIAQTYTPARRPNVFDILFNVIGTVAGAGICAPFTEQYVLGWWRRGSERRDQAALLLLLVGFGYLLFPFFPVLSPTTLFRKFALFAATPALNLVVYGSATVAWLVGGHLLSAVGAGSPARCLAFSVLAVPAQLFVFARQPNVFMLLGALTGLVLFLQFGRYRWRRLYAGATMLLIMLRQLSPFRLQETRNGFSVVPFGGLLYTDWQIAVVVLLEKAFYYGIGIWTLTRTGIDLRVSVTTIAVLSLGLEVAQIFLAGRTPSITDPILVLLIGFAIASLDAFSQRARNRGAAEQRRK